MGADAGIRIRTRRAPYYGWVVTGALATTETVSWGVLYYAFSVFLVPMQRDLGWSTAAITGAYSLGLLISGLAALPVGRWLDRRGPRLLMTAGSVLGALLVFAWSHAASLGVFYLIWAGIGLAMAATLYEPAFATVTVWFDRDRGKAFLAVTLLAGLASTIFLPLSSWLVAAFGWRHALVTLAVLLGAVTIPLHGLVLRRRPEDLGLQPDGRPPRVHEPLEADRPRDRAVTPSAAFHDPVFWWLSTAFALETFSSAAVGVHLIPYLTDRGDGARFAAAATGLIGAAQVIARIMTTLFGGRLSQVTLTAMVFALQAVAIAVLMSWRTKEGVIVAVLLLGAGRGAVTLMRAGLVAEFYGRTYYGSINGMMSFFLTGARSIAPVGAGVAYTLAGAYPPVLWGMAGASLLAAASMIGVHRQQQRPRALPRAAQP